MGAIHARGFTEQLYKQCPGKLYVRDFTIKHSDDKTERRYIITKAPEVLKKVVGFEGE